MAVAPSLFDAPATAVLPSASDWTTQILFGGLATGLCVLAVAFVGLMLMTGRVAVRDGLRVAIGCFVLLGAPLIASGLRDLAGGTEISNVPQVQFQAPSQVGPQPGNYDPYAGASMRRD